MMDVSVGDAAGKGVGVSKIRISSMLLGLAVSLSFGSLAQAKDYTVSGGDRLRVDVMDHPEFSITTQVRPDGKISFPLVGDVFARGFTPTQLAAAVATKIEPYAKDAPVSVFVTDFFNSVVTVLGGVRSPGRYPVFEPTSIMDAISMAGGGKDEEVKRVRVFRADGEVKNVSLESVWRHEGNVENREDLMLYPGDSMYVYESFRIKWSHVANAYFLATATFFLYDRLSEED